MPALSPITSCPSGSSNSHEPSKSVELDPLTTSTRGLSVSFNGDSFFYQTVKSTKPTPCSIPTAKRRTKPHSENRSPDAAVLRGDLLMRSLNCSVGKKDPIMAALRLLLLDRRTEDSANTDITSTVSNTEKKELKSLLPPPSPSQPTDMPRGINVPARFWQETNRRLRRLPDPGSRTPKNSSYRGPEKPTLIGNQLVAPSLIAFSAEVRKSNRGEERIEEAHLLRLSHSRHLQWRFVNARSNQVLVAQQLAVQVRIYGTWKAHREMRYGVASKTMKLRQLGQSLKLASILGRQMTWLEKWSEVENEHTSSLLGASDALKASTLRLPIIGDAMVGLRDMNDALDSASSAMQAARSSISSLFFRTGAVSRLAADVAQLAAEERVLLEECREIVKTVEVLHVIQCSLRGRVMQLRCCDSGNTTHGPSSWAYIRPA